MCDPRPFLAAIRQCAILYAPDGTVSAANDRAEALAGRSLAGLAATDLISLFSIRHRDGSPLAAGDLPAVQALAGKESVDVPLTVSTGDGRVMHILTTASPVRNENAITGALSVWQDVTHLVLTEEEQRRLRADAETLAKELECADEERTEQQAALQRSEAMLRAVLDQMPSGVTIRDARSGELLLSNARSREIVDDLVDCTGRFGRYGRLQASGKPYLTGDWPVTRSMATGEVVDAEEVQCERSDGTRITLSISSAPVYDLQGRLIIGVSIFHDITDRKRAEEALRESEERLRLAQTSAEIGIWDRDVATGTVTISPEILQRFEIPGGTVRTYDEWERLIYPGDRERVATERDAALASGGPIDLEFRILLPSGRVRWLQFRARGTTDDRGGLVRVIGVIIDISARKKVEAALEGISRIVSAALICETEEEFGEVCLRVAETVTASQFGFIGEITESGLEEIAISDPGRDRCTIIGPSGHRRSPGTLALRGLFGRVLVDGRSLFTNDPFNHPDSIGIPPGHPWLSAFLGVPLIRDGQTIGIIAVANRDGGYGEDEQNLLEALAPSIVEAFARKRAEQRLKRYATQLQTSNEELQRFAYVASHDLQEPLRSIVSFSQLLARRYEGRLDADADEYIRFIVEGGNRMQALIRDLLQVSRLERPADTPVPTDPAVVAADALRALEAPVRESGAVVTVDELPAVMAVPAQLEQVFTNLIGNAIKYHRSGVPPAVRISAERRDATVEFAVADNGIGIEPEYHDRIFEMFRRLHTHDRYNGTGIGLAVVKRIVERLGGTVRVESAPGEGSTFFFTLPAA